MTPTDHRISLIIPLRLTAGTFEARQRLARIIDSVPKALYEIIISDYGTAPEHDGPIREAEAAGARVVRHPAPEPLFSIGKARDFGVRMAQCPVILFNDIDFLATPEGYAAIHAETLRRAMAANPFDAFCVPVHFLTEAGSRDWLSGHADGRDILAGLDLAAIEAMDGTIQFTAFGSSAMVVNRDHYLALGGHAPDFRGHGAEDYEFLHRLASLAPLGPWPNDYLTDTRQNGVRAYWGFRAFFALFGLGAFLSGIRMVHLHHPRRTEKGYFRARQNFRILRRAMTAFDRHARQPEPLTSGSSSRRLGIVARNRQEAMNACRQIVPRYGSVVVASTAEGLDADDIAIVKRDRDGRLSVVFAGQAGQAAQAAAGSGRPLHLATRTGKPIEGFFERWTLPDGTILTSGAMPATLPLDHPVFLSFGGPDLLDTRRHPRPARRKKSPWHIRLWRALTGR